MKKKHFVSLIHTIKDTLHAHSKANWDDRNVVETVAEVITKKFARYIKEQEDLDKMGKTEEDYMIPPGGLNR
tara:strand:+ start:75 stop:290 length:216 start_codon:yes stop_codon:yes gene_type:complete